MTLTTRQLEVVRRRCLGQQFKAQARVLHLSRKTVEYHFGAACRRIGLHDIADLTRWAIRTGLVTALVLVMGFVVQAQVSPKARAISLAWEPSQGAAGYRLYYGAASGVYTRTQDVGMVTNVSVIKAWPGGIYAAATAYDTNGLESPFSNEASWTPRPTPTNRIVRLDVVSGADLRDAARWGVVWSLSMTNPAGAGFYALRISKTEQ